MLICFIRKTRDGKQRLAVPNKEFGQCVFLNDVPLEELRSVLKIHKEFIKSRYGTGEGEEAYVDAGDLGVEPEAYANGSAQKAGDAAASLKRNGINGNASKEAAVKAGGVPIDGTGVITNGVSHTLALCM